MDLRQIECFVHVAELGSFTRAANFLSIAQPVLSRQVRALEIELRQTLFERNGRGVTVTEPGRRLLEHGRGILAQVDRARLDMEETRGSASGRVVVAMPPSVSDILSAPLIRAFRAQFPEGTLYVLEGQPPYVLEWLAIGRADCAVLYTVPSGGDVDMTPVLNEKLYLVSRGDGEEPGLGLPAREPASMSQIAKCPLVIPRRPTSMRGQLEANLAQEALKPKIVLEIESVQAILNLIRHDGLHGILPLNSVRSSLNVSEYRCRPIPAALVADTLWIARSALRPHGPLLEPTARLIKQKMQELWEAGESTANLHAM